MNDSDHPEERKAICSNTEENYEKSFVFIFFSEWRAINDSDGFHRESLHIERPCPFRADILESAYSNKKKLLAVGVLGAFLGCTGIHFFLTNHINRSCLRLFVFCLVGALMWFGFQTINSPGRVAFALISVCWMAQLILFLFGFEEGRFLCNLATYETRMRARRRMNTFLSNRVGGIKIETIIKTLITVVFIGSMGYFYWYAMIR